MEELIEKYEDLIYAFKDNPKFQNVNNEFELPADNNIIEQALKNGLNNDFPPLFKETNGLMAYWEFDRSRNLIGKIHINQLESILESWGKELYFEGLDARLKHFRPLDLFVEEACCGIVIDGSDDQCIYYHDYGSENILSLDIDFKTYFELAIDAKILSYWQRYLVYLVNGNQNIEVSFPARIKEVFPDFDLEAFTAKFESLRLSKR
jgi:hypothetical protein